ncbi:hypothetical protein PYCCODRAFT_1478569 [Trametes coccinea BRFM310]|uniref:Queuosine 5'-phosphate N-glycosylase/hydrolase n=1 Tax=Trametes coccinea (strain BRFM310) TaxID=1353009 RepID=A0A1Y2IJI6_TRAC3|nr:hypothetical protein PYCCODRAFT_1478569 [Trametes coccinea BRFM310]
MSNVPLPPSGEYIKAVRESSRAARTKANVSITPESIKRFLLSPAFTSTFARLRSAHGMTMPLNFPSVASELNVLSVLSILNFASGYRVPLHKATGRGAFDNIRAFIFGAWITSSTGAGDDFSAEGMASMTEATVADLMRVTDLIHVERAHESIPGVTVGELGGPIWEVVQLITKTLKETGEALKRGGYPDLGSFVLEALKEGEKAKKAGKDEADVALERLVRGIPAFQDMALVYGQPVYCFKKAMLTLHSVALRFGNSESSIPIPRTTHLPIFSDNVIPSLLVHLGVIDLTNADSSLGLPQLFPDAQNPERLQALLSAAEPVDPAAAKKEKEVPKEGPLLTVEQAFILRAAAIDACELIVQTAQELDTSDAAEDLSWLKGVTLPEIDAWIWAVAKDRPDYRKLERFALRNTAYF